MINAGAYSKKYQSIERERMREIKDREKKFSKERSLFLSIQTSQRQKAMEEKKRAMAEAEEERRRKALEDRRQSQQQATDRFRSVMGRIKNPTPAGRKFSFPAKSKATKCSFLHKKNMVSSQVEVRSQVKYRDQGDTEIDQERLALVKDVKVLPTTPPLKIKSPSLDNVFDQSDETNPSNQQNKEVQMPLLNRSASETNLTQVKLLQLAGEYSDSTLSKENAFFHPSIRTLPAPESRDSLLEITAVSPVEKEFCVTNSPGVPDSLNSSPNIDFQETASQRNKELSLSESCGEQLKCSAYESDTSNDDSLEETAHTSSSTLKFHTSNKQGPVVGILKKSKPSSIRPMNIYNPSRFNSSVPQDTCSSKHHRKVRFSDQVEVDSRNTSPIVMNITDPVQIELWKRVFPKELSPQSVPNSAFTPKMKCFLSSKQRPKRNSTPSTVFEDPQKLNSQVDIPESTHHTVTTKTLDKTPTDAEINTMWDQIRQCLQDDKKVSIPPRVFNFKPPPSENGIARRTLTRPVTLKTSMPMNKLPSNTKSFSSASSSDPHRSNKHLVYRQPNPSKLRVHHNNSHPGPVTILYSTPLQQEPVFKAPGQSKESSKSFNASVSDLSLEEEKLMHSIERINQKLKDNLDAPLLRTQYYYPTPPPKKPSDQTHLAARPRVVSEFNRTTFGDNHSSVLHPKHSSHVT